MNKYMKKIKLKGKKKEGNRPMRNKKRETPKNVILFLEPLVGFEPTTPRLQITCSGQLS